MTDPKDEVASAYGEGGLEAEKMSETAAGSTPAVATVPDQGAVEAEAGTTETDVAANQRRVADRESNP